MSLSRDTRASEGSGGGPQGRGSLGLSGVTRGGGDGWGQESGPRLDNASANLQELGEFTKLSEAGSPLGRVGAVILPRGFP